MAVAKVWVACALCLLLATSWASAERPPTPWQTVKTPAPGTPRAIGDYSAGCVQGAQALPLAGPGYQVMHPSRVRHFGHPELLDFIAGLGRAVHAAGLAPIMVGDLSQPRGGRASGGHASHQTGLDVDLWYWLPKAAEKRALDEREREQIKARSVLDAKTAAIKAEWSARVAQLLQMTASDARVARVFVHPIIKRELCQHAQGDRGWLQKIRPWHGHDDHFHVRLTCPIGSPDCRPQTPVATGDGCGEELAWWFSDEARGDRDEAKKTYQAKVVRGPRVPAQCFALIAPPATSNRTAEAATKAASATSPSPN